MTATLSTVAPRPPRRIRMLIPIGLAAGGLMLAAVLGTVMAITGTSVTCLTTDSSGSTGPAGPAPTQTAISTIPRARLGLYELAGRRFDINWTFLASIGTQECNNGECAGNNGSGCGGPMQIAYLPNTPCSPGPGLTLWDRYKVPASGGPPNIDNPADAVFTAAQIFREAMGAPPTGGSYQAYYQAACRYYGACADATVSYASEVMARAVLLGFHGTGSPPPTSPVGAQPVSTGGEQCNQDTTVSGPVDGNRIVRVAESQIGQSEHPPGSNCTKYGPCEEWCALFAAWVWQHAGVPMPGGTSPYAYSGTVDTWAKANRGRVLPPSARPAPGDAVLYGTGPTNSAHVGIVERVFPGGEITTIEGNFNNQVQRNGPFIPADAVQAGEPAPIYAYAQPPIPQAGGRQA